jgi:hypothetical protein
MPCGITSDERLRNSRAGSGGIYSTNDSGWSRPDPHADRYSHGYGDCHGYANRHGHAERDVDGHVHTDRDAGWTGSAAASWSGPDAAGRTGPDGHAYSYTDLLRPNHSEF